MNSKKGNSRIMKKCACMAICALLAATALAGCAQAKPSAPSNPPKTAPASTPSAAPAPAKTNFPGDPGEDYTTPSAGSFTIIGSWAVSWEKTPNQTLYCYTFRDQALSVAQYLKAADDLAAAGKALGPRPSAEEQRAFLAGHPSNGYYRYDAEKNSLTLSLTSRKRELHFENKNSFTVYDETSAFGDVLTYKRSANIAAKAQALVDKWAAELGHSPQPSSDTNPLCGTWTYEKGDIRLVDVFDDNGHCLMLDDYNEAHTWVSNSYVYEYLKDENMLVTFDAGAGEVNWINENEFTIDGGDTHTGALRFNRVMNMDDVKDVIKLELWRFDRP